MDRNHSYRIVFTSRLHLGRVNFNGGNQLKVIKIGNIWLGMECACDIIEDRKNILEKSNSMGKGRKRKKGTEQKRRHKEKKCPKSYETLSQLITLWYKFVSWFNFIATNFMSAFSFPRYDGTPYPNYYTRRKVCRMEFYFSSASMDNV